MYAGELLREPVVSASIRWNVMANAMKFGAQKIRSAVRSTLEQLEQRMLLSAGNLDTTLADTGYLLQVQNGGYGPLGRAEYAYWNNPGSASTGFISNHDIFLDAGGKLITVGATLGRHVTPGAPPWVIINPDPAVTGTMEVDVGEHFDSDISVTRYGVNGGLNVSAQTNTGGFTENGLPLCFAEDARAGAVDASGTPETNPFYGSVVVIGPSFVARYSPYALMLDNIVPLPMVGVAGGGSTAELIVATSANDMLIQPDGKIIIAGASGDGYTGADFTLWRLNPDLTLDTTFGTGGFARHNFISYSDDEVMAIAIQPPQITNSVGTLVANPQAGKIMAIGYSDDSTWKADGKSKMVIARYNTDGSFDNTFGLSGMLEIADFGGQDAIGLGIAVQRDGKAVALGAYDGNPGIFIDPTQDANPFDTYRGADALDSTVVVRVNQNGTIDQNTFGARGRLQLSDPVAAVVGQSIGFESTGKIIISGVASDMSGSYATVTRLTSGGLVDTTYGTNGVTVLTEFGNTILTDLYYSTKVAIQSDDKAFVSANRALTSNWVQPAFMDHAADKADYVADGLIARVQADNKAPRAQLLTQDITLTQAGATTFNFLVNYSDDGYVSLLSLAGQDILVTGPNGFGAYATIVGSPVGAGPSSGGNYQRFTVQYRVAFGTPLPINGSMNGAYTITLLNPVTDPGLVGAGVSDTMGLYASRRILGQFDVAIRPSDQTGPTATLISLPANPMTDPASEWDATGNNGAVVGGGATLDFIVEYVDSQSNVNVALLGTGDITVTGPSNYSQVATLVSVDTLANSPTVRARYRITAPGGTWDTTDNGVYYLNLGVNEVGDDYAAPNYASAGVVATFNVSVVPGVTATLSDASGNPINSIAFNQAGDFQNFFVHYRPANDNIIDPATFRDNGNAITVSSSNPAFSGNAQYLSDVSDGAGGYIVAYQVYGPWDATSNGNYIVRINADQVGDFAGHFAPAGDLGQMNITIGATPTLTAAIVPPLLAPLPGSTNFTVTVEYADSVAIDVASIDSGDIAVVRSGDSLQLLPVGTPTIDVAGNGTPRRVTYTFAAPGGIWNAPDNGTWVIQLLPGQVRNVAGNAVSAGDIGSFAFLDQAPVLTQVAYTVPVVGPADFPVALTFADETAIKVSSILANSVQVNRIANGPAVSLQLAAITPNPSVDNPADGTPRVFTFTFAPLGGYWDSSDNGTYQIVLSDGAVTDVGGQPVAGGIIATFELQLVPDVLGPVATLTVAPALRVPGVSVYSVEITYTDATAVDPQWLLDGNPDIEFVTPNGDVIDGVLIPGTVSSTVPAPTITARYQLLPPSGGSTFTSADNGLYTVRVKPGAIADVTGNFAASVDLTPKIAVQISDAAGPSVELVQLDPPAVLAPTAEVVVTYRDAIGVDLTTIGLTDVVLTRGATTLAATSFTAVPTDSTNTEVTVTYVFDAPGNTWNFAENGTWSAKLVANEVFDVTGFPAEATDLGTFDFMDEAPVGTVIDPLPDFVIGTGNISITIEYRDDVAMDPATFDAGDIRVTRTSGTPITLVSAAAPVVAASTDPAVRVVTYSFLAPGGYWESSDNGVYDVVQVQNQVADTGGQFALPGSIGEVVVDFDQDSDPPTATLVSAPRITAATATYSFRVRYDDATAVDFRTLGDGDLAFSGPGGSFSVRAVSIIPAAYARSIEVVYEVAKAGGFTAADNGTYNITGRVNQVADVAGNYIPGGQLIGSVNVAIPLPVVDAFLASTARPVQTAATLTFQVTFSSSNPLDINSIINNNGAIRVTGPNGYQQMASYVAIDSTSNGSPRTATYQIVAPGGAWDFGDNGSYTVAAIENNGVRNVLGGTLPAKTLGTFSVTLTATYLEGRTLRVTGTDVSDTIELLMSGTPAAPTIRVLVNNVASEFAASLVSTVRVDALNGNDTVKINTGVPASYLDGGAGNDTLLGGDYADTLFGGSGDDYMVGGAGGDLMYGGSGNDRMAGTAGPDTLHGEDGNDTVTGGNGRDFVYGDAGNDELNGSKGMDMVYGGDGNDIIFARDGQSDTVDGGAGYNRASIDDSLDVYVNIAELLA